MSTFNSSLEYDITTEAEVANILSHFETEQIFDLIDDSLKRKHMFYPNNPINLVQSINMNFDLIIARFPEDKNRIEGVKIKTYLEIIEKICLNYNLEFTDDNIQDYFSTAFYLYDLLISRYSQNIVLFFTNYINKEKDYLYDYVGLIEMKKNKDMSSAYTRKVHKDHKLGTISANLEYVIDSISLFDISLDILLNIFNPNISILLLSSIQDKGNLFKDYFINTINNPEFKSIYLTNIRFALLEIDNNINGGSLNE